MTRTSPSVRPLISAYKKVKPEIRKRLLEFHEMAGKADDKIFSELSYCILTANANAERCDEAIKILEKSELLLKGRAHHIRPILQGRARFHNKKADYIIAARQLFKNGKKVDIKSRLDIRDIVSTRDWLVENIKGFGYKEASHFLRNVGFGRDIAILDRHILKNLKKYRVIDHIPNSVGSRKIYMDIEDRMRRFSKAIRIPMEDLDLLFWSIQTGFIFK